jgi:pimeloyl-ACP methyl ester carboxylesterase
MPESGNLFYFGHKTQALGDLPVVFIHGAGGTHMHWPPHLRRLAGCRIYAPDLAAHGKSSGTPRSSIDEHAQDLIQFVSSLGIPSAVWIGHSMGSAIALEIALLHPERVKALVLIGGGAKLRVHPEILSSAGDPNLFGKAVGLLIEQSYGDKADPKLRKIGHKQMQANRTRVLYGDLLACENFDIRDQLNKVQQPTLILCGRDDRMTPVKYSEYLDVNLSNSILHVQQDAGHMVMLEQPAWVGMEIDTFLQPFKNLGTPPIQE